MSEKLRPSFERELSTEEMDALSSAVENYLSEQSEPIGEVADKNIDDILSRYMEKGPELSPDVKASLRNAIRRILGNQIGRQ